MFIEKSRAESFQDLVAWRKSKQLSLAIYHSFSSCRDFGFRDQLQRASVSIMNNIAEGYERAGSKELARFLVIAKGSSAEVRSMLELAQELKYVGRVDYEELCNLAEDVSRLLTKFIRTLNVKRSTVKR